MSKSQDDRALVRVEDADGIAVVVLDEPEKRNPLSPRLVDELTAALRALAGDDGVGGVVVTGAGSAFCAGADLRRLRAAAPLEDRHEYDRILALNRLLWSYPKVTVAAVNGPALGAGANLVGWCDLAVAGRSAIVGYPEVKAGVASATVVATLLRLVGRKRMNALLLGGEPITAAEAERIGLVNDVVADADVLAAALALARRVAGRSTESVRLTKEVIRVATDMEYDKALEYARDVRVLSRLAPDFQRRIAAHVEGAGQEGGR